MDYQQKYLKYKGKYLSLKNQIGGTETSALARFGKEQILEEFTSRYEILDSYKLIFIICRKRDDLIFKVNLTDKYPINPPIVCYIDTKVKLGEWAPARRLYQLLDEIETPPVLIPHQSNNSEKCGVEIVKDIYQYVIGYSYPLTPNEYLEFMIKNEHISNISKLKLAATLHTGDELDTLFANWMYFERDAKIDIIRKMSIYLTEKNGYPTNLNVTEVPNIPGHYSGLLFFSEPHLTELSTLFKISQKRGRDILIQWQKPMTVEMDFVYIAFGDLDRKKEDTEKEWGIVNLSKLTEIGRGLYTEWKK